MIMSIGKQFDTTNNGKRTLSFLRGVFCLFISVNLIVNQPTPAFSYFQDEIDSSVINDESKNISSSDDDIITNVCGSFTFINNFSFLRKIPDMVINTGEKISFNIFRHGFNADNFNCIALDAPEGALLKHGIFTWTPMANQAGTYKVTFVVTGKDGKQEVLSVTFDILEVFSSDSGDFNTKENEQTDDGGSNNTAGEKAIKHLPHQRNHSFKKKAQHKLEDVEKEEEDDESEEEDEEDKEDKEDNNEVKTTLSSSNSGSGFTVSSTWFTAGGTTIYKNNSSTTTQNSSASSTSSTTNSNSVLTGSSSGEGQSSTSQSSSSSSDNNAQEQDPPVITPAGTAPDAPMLNDPAVSSFNGVFRIEWTDTGAFIYELQQSLDKDFTTVTNTFFPTGNYEDLDEAKQPDSGYYYYRVRAWSDLPQNGGLSSEFSNIVVIGVDYERDIDILSFPTINIFTEIAGAPGTSVTWVNDVEAYSEPVLLLDYDISQQFFAGAYFTCGVPFDISEMNTINIRLRGHEVDGYPVRMIIELKSGGQIQGVILLSDLTSAYQDISFPFYSEVDEIDEVVIFIEDDTDGDRLGGLYIDEFFFSKLTFMPDINPDINENAGPGLSDEEVLDKVEADTALYFYDQIVGPGHVKDTSETPYSSIAATGFGLTALAVLAERYGTSDFWQTVTPQMARDRVEAILDDLLRIQQNQIANSAEYGTAGFFYHFIDSEGKRSPGSEVSLVDTALLIIGALTAGEYFGGDIKDKADLLYDSIDWTFFIDENTYQYHMGWKPESSRGFTTPKDGGYISNGTYNLPSDEVLLISLLALGNHFDDEMVRKSYFSYPRNEKKYTATSGDNEGTEYTVVNSYFGSLFTYLYAHCYFDFQNLGIDQTYFAPDAPYPVSVNWWDNSVQAIMANRQFCIDQREYYPFSYSENSWGISAVQRPDGRYEGRYGAVPFNNGPGNDGVVALYCSLSSMPFFKTSSYELPSENEAYQAMRYFYNNYFTQMYGQYGFYESFDNKGNFSNVYLGLDQGPIVLMIENYRSNLIWDTLIQNEKLSDVIDLVFADSFDWLDVKLKNITDDTDTTELLFGSHEVGTQIAPAEQYAEIDYNFKFTTGRLVIYTDNENNTVPYTGDENAGGLVGTFDATQVAPIHWVTFDAPVAGGYVFSGDSPTEGLVQDVSDDDFSLPDRLTERTIVDGEGLLAPYPTIDRTMLSSTVYVYFGCDFSGLEAQDYNTDTLTIEIYHE